MAATDYFLVITGVKGETGDSEFKGKNGIDIQSWSWGESNPTTAGAGGGLGAGKVSVQDLHFTAMLSTASAPLVAACATGKHFEKVQLFARKAGGKKQETYFEITLNHVLVTSYQVGGSSGGDIVPVDQVSLAFGKIQLSYKPQKADGSLDAPVIGGWDVSKRVKA
jgi:type VI secretion system secreted protein Hcp